MQPARTTARAERPRASYVLETDPSRLSCAMLLFGVVVFGGLALLALATAIVGGAP